MSEQSRLRLLIVDDELSVSHLCRTVAEAMDFECTEAASGEAALALLEERPVHMILCDMVLPQMTGLDFLSRVKKILPRVEVALIFSRGFAIFGVEAEELVL